MDEDKGNNVPSQLHLGSGDNKAKETIGWENFQDVFAYVEAVERNEAENSSDKAMAPTASSYVEESQALKNISNTMADLKDGNLFQGSTTTVGMTDVVTEIELNMPELGLPDINLSNVENMSLPEAASCDDTGAVSTHVNMANQEDTPTPGTVNDVHTMPEMEVRVSEDNMLCVDECEENISSGQNGGGDESLEINIGGPADADLRMELDGVADQAWEPESVNPQGTDMDFIKEKDASPSDIGEGSICEQSETDLKPINSSTQPHVDEKAEQTTSQVDVSCECSTFMSEQVPTPSVDDEHLPSAAAADEHTIFHEGEEPKAAAANIKDKTAETREQKSGKRQPLSEEDVQELQRIGYWLPQDNGKPAVSDLVWGKVPSHPWWPGQVFSPSDASEKALKCHKPNRYLVAYFGDQTFAWTEPFRLMPFYQSFSEMEGESSSESYQNAVDCALEEVSKRVEFGLACSCLQKQVYEQLKFQKLENYGIRPESSMRTRLDRYTNALSFEPSKFVRYMKSLSWFPSLRFNELEVVIARAQLIAFLRFKGIYYVPEFLFCGRLFENDHLLSDQNTREPKTEEQNSRKRQRGTGEKSRKGPSMSSKKMKSVSELMSVSPAAQSGKILTVEKVHGKILTPPTKSRKVSRSVTVSPPTASPVSPFRVGESIQRAAIRLTRSQLLKQDPESCPGLERTHMKQDPGPAKAETERVKDSGPNAENASFPEALLSNLHLLAANPLNGYDLASKATFFTEFRNSVGGNVPREVYSVPMEDSGGDRRRANSVRGNVPKDHPEFDDFIDTYWTDRVIQCDSEGKPPKTNDFQPVFYVGENPDAG